MKARIRSWESWCGDYISVEVDEQMLLTIIEYMDGEIDVAVSEKRYEDAMDLIENRLSLEQKLAKKAEENAERESSEND